MQYKNNKGKHMKSLIKKIPYILPISIGLMCANQACATDGYTLFNPNGHTETYLINSEGVTVHTWHSQFRPALSVYLLESGEL